MPTCCICQKSKEKLFRNNTCSWSCNSLLQSSVLLKSFKHNSQEKRICSHCKESISKVGIKKHEKNCLIRNRVCKNCNKPFKASMTTDPKIFCSRSCAAIYNNAHKKTPGCRRSRFELYVEQQLKQDFSQLQIFFNDRSFLGLELDIYFPQLKLAIEINGILHYEPIYGTVRLEKMQNKDKQKLIQCYKNDIELAIINTNCYMSKKKISEYYEIIKGLITKNLGRVCAPDANRTRKTEVDRF